MPPESALAAKKKSILRLLMIQPHLLGLSLSLLSLSLFIIIDLISCPDRFKM